MSCGINIIYNFTLQIFNDEFGKRGRALTIGAIAKQSLEKYFHFCFDLLPVP